MTLTLKNFQSKNCDIFIQNLIRFKESITGKDIETKMNDLHVSFLVLMNSFQIDTVPNQLVNGEPENIKLVIAEDLVLDVDDSHPELANQFVNKNVELAKELSVLFFDYENRCCDFCGKYFVKYTFIKPERRMKMDDFALAYHPCCYNEDLMKFYLF